MKAMRHKIALLSLLALPAMLVVATAGSAAAAPQGSAAAAKPAAVTSSSLGTFKPTFVGSAATGCAGCHLLTGPIRTPSTANLSASQTLVKAPNGKEHAPKALPYMHPKVPTGAKGGSVIIPTVSCVPLRPGCDNISSFAGGSTGVKGLNAVDSATHTANIFKDVEPPDQGLCAGNGNVVETNNIGEILIFNTALKRVSPVISLDRLMGLTKLGWSSGGDPSCLYDSSNGGHWFFTEIVSASKESQGGAFTGCFAGVANACLEGIAVTQGSNPFGPYNVYFLHADYNPKEPGSPSLLNDYAKISSTRDSFMLFYDEFPLLGSLPGFGGGFFNGAQQFAFNKNAMELGLPVANVTVARENMGLLKTPNGTCFSDNKYFEPGIACWFSVIPAVPAGPSQWDNSNGGSGYMLATLDFYALGGNQLAAFDWTGLRNLNSAGCSTCSAIRFGGQLFSNVERYYNNGSLPSGFAGAQAPGPIPLGDECGAAGLSTLTSCPEGGIASNSDQVTQASQANGQLWVGVSTALIQTFSGGTQQQHLGAAYWAIGAKGGSFSFTGQGYVSALQQDLEFPTMAAGATNGRTIMSFTLNGTSFFPSSAFGRVTTSSNGLLQSTINIADPGQSPQDGFTEYQGYPGGTRPRWGDYGGAIFLNGKVFFASEYIQYPNCLPPKFTLTIGTCGGTRDGNANWGTSVNSVTP